MIQKKNKMNIEELKERLNKFDLSEIKSTGHLLIRVQDKRRKINYPQLVSLLTTQKGLYKFQEQTAKYLNELKFKLWFKLNYLYDINLYIVMNKEIKEKGLNRLEIISAHKVKRKIQQEIRKNES